MERAEIQKGQKQVEALVAKAEEENSIDSLREALHLCLLLTPELSQSDDPVAWAEHRIGTARVADSLGRKTQQERYLNLALAEYQAALTVFTLEAFSERWIDVRFAISYVLFGKTLYSQSKEDAEAGVVFAQESIRLMPESGDGAYLALSSSLSARYTLNGVVQDAIEAAQALNHISDAEEQFTYFIMKATMWLQAAKAERNLESAEKSLHYAIWAQDAMSKGESPMPLIAQPAIDQAKAFIQELKSESN